MSIFEKAQQAQLNISQVYSLLGQRFVNNPKLRALFVLLSEEKKSQMRRIEEVARCWAESDEQWSLAMEEAKMDRLLEKSEVALARLVHTAEMSAARALELALAVESDLDAARAKALARETCPGMRAMLEEFVAHDHGHRYLLAQAQISA